MKEADRAILMSRDLAERDLARRICTDIACEIKTVPISQREAAVGKKLPSRLELEAEEYRQRLISYIGELLDKVNLLLPAEVK